MSCRITVIQRIIGCIIIAVSGQWIYYYFNNTLEDIYKQWVQHRAETQIVSQKTIEEDIGIWNRFIADTELARMQIAEIKPVHIMKLFQIWTGNEKITRKGFNNRKSVLNGIFRHAVLNEIITFSPITDLPCNTLKFKLPNASKKAYTVEERAMLLSYLKTLEQDAYTLAIQFAFYGIFRVGEIKGLTWDTKNANITTIKQQLVEERTLQDDMTFSHPHHVLKDPKGNPFYSIRTEELPEAGIAILRKMKEQNPLYQHLDAFDAGVKAIDIQPLLGHSNLAMTQHYI